MKKNTLFNKETKEKTPKINEQGGNEQKEAGSGGFKRILPVLLVFLCTLLLAVLGGVTLALLDMGKAPHDLLNAMSGRVMVETMAAENTVSDSSLLSEVQEKEVSENTAEPETAEVSASESENELQLVSTDETANIATIVRAGNTDEMIAGSAVSADSVSDNSISVNSITDPTTGYPLPFSTVDLSYFDDALFIGDSRMEGFGMRSGTNATFYATKGFQLHKYETMKVAQTVEGKVPIFDALPLDAYTKIYIKVGLNELGSGTDETFLAKYAELIARLRACEPRAVIYIHGLLPVTAKKSSTDSVHTNEKIAVRDALLKQFASEQKAYYIDINSVVSDTDGSLKPEMTTDGIHLKSEYMDLWREYLRTHAVVLP